MERILTPEDKIRRAQEIYARRNNKAYVAVNVSEKKNTKALKKVLTQMLICVLLYMVFYFIQNTNYFFSEDVISGTKNLLSYDVDLNGLYHMIQKSILVDNSEEEQMDNKQIEEAVSEEILEPEDTQIQEEQTIEATLDAYDVNENYEEETVGLDQMQMDANDIKANYSIIKPLEKYVVSSEFGTREVNNPLITPYHPGIDLAIDEGTNINAAMDGTVVISKYSTSYGNYIKIENGDLQTVYAHCKTLYVKEGETVTQGQHIADVGATGDATRASFAL